MAADVAVTVKDRWIIFNNTNRLGLPADGDLRYFKKIFDIVRVYVWNRS